jgi:hypothetical protein
VTDEESLKPRVPNAAQRPGHDVGERKIRPYLSVWRMPMPAAFFVVRAIVSDPAKRAPFDAWYRNEHLPDAVKAFGVTKAWRCWSVSDPALHQATYQFADQAALHRALGGEALKVLVAEFDRAWPDIKRTREILLLAEEFGAE